MTNNNIIPPVDIKLIEQELNENTFVSLEEDIKEDHYINIYPNPTNSTLNIKLEQSGTIEIYDVNGRIILQSSVLANQVFTINHLSPGVYFAKVNLNQKIITKKIIVNQ